MAVELTTSGYLRGTLPGSIGEAMKLDLGRGSSNDIDYKSVIFIKYRPITEEGNKRRRLSCCRR
jgi:hypothetical protein